VYVHGALAFHRGRPAEGLGRTALGTVLTTSGAGRDEAAERERRRNRIDRDTVDHPFADYWDVFVLKHRHPLNVAMHLLGFAVFFGLLVALWHTRRPEWLLALPAFQLAGLLGHWLFEKSHIDRQDAVFSLRASWCLVRMLVTLARGRYPAEVARVTARLREHRAR
jgi:hypothetical protein